MSDILKIFSANLKRLRLKQNLTQEQLAQMLNYSKKSVSKWESGHALPPSAILPSIAKLLKTSIDDMMSEIEEVKYYMGIAGYDSQTDFALADANGRIIRNITLGNSNPIDIGVDAMKSIMSSGIFQVIGNIPFNTVSVFAGIDGFYMLKNDELANHLRGLNFASVRCASNSFSAIKMALGDNEGIFVSLGVGSVVFGKKAGKRPFRIGGYGYLFDEPCSKYALGKAVLSAVLHEEDGSGDATVLSEMVSNEIQARYVTDRFSDIYMGIAGKRIEISQFNHLLFEAIAKGDKVAINILTNEIQKMCKMVEAAAKRFDNEAVSVVLCGSLLEFESYILPLFKQHLSSGAQRYAVSVCNTPMTYGAIEMAKTSEEQTRG